MKSVAYIDPQGVVRCYHGTIAHFATDIVKYITPLIDSSITCSFNGVTFVVYKLSTREEIINSWVKLSF